MDFLDHATRLKKDVPSPDHYKINRSILVDEKGKKGSFSKLPKISYVDAIYKKKETKPDPTTYTVEVKDKIKGNFKWHEERVGYLDECKVKANDTPLCYDVKYT